MFKPGQKLKSKSLVITIQGNIGEIYFFTYGKGASSYETIEVLKNDGFKPVKSK